MHACLGSFLAIQGGVFIFYFKAMTALVAEAQVWRLRSLANRGLATASSPLDSESFLHSLATNGVRVLLSRASFSTQGSN